MVSYYEQKCPVYRCEQPTTMLPTQPPLPSLTVSDQPPITKNPPRIVENVSSFYKRIFQNLESSYWHLTIGK